MDKKLNDAIMALPEMKERLNRLYSYADEKHKILKENVAVNIRLTTKTVANGIENEVSIDINNKLRELLDKPLK